MQRKNHLKNLNTAALALALGATATTITGAQAQTTQPAFGQGARVRLNGRALKTSVPPIVRNGSTLVPMRDIFEALGATVVWDQDTQQINAQKDATRVWLQIGNRTARVDEDQKWLSQAPILYNASTLVPLRFVSEALGADVKWNGERRVVRITTDGGLADRDVADDEVFPATSGEEVAASITIPSGAVVPVTLDETLSSETAKVGDSFTTTIKSERAGDSEFPSGTKLRGRITQARAMAEGSPGVLGVEFREAVFPDGETVAIFGDLISLDKTDVTQSQGRIMARPGKGGTDVKIVGIGAAAGYVLGKVLGKNELITAILGAAGGYAYDRSRDKGKEQEAVVSAGTTLGVRLSRAVTYTDSGNYLSQRQSFMD